jgi:hypothetical protein
MRHVLTLFIALALVACGSSDTTTTSSAPPAEGVVAAQPPQGAGPRTLAVGQAPVSVEVPVPPSFDITIADNAEYQIDAVSDVNDPQAFLYQGDNLVEQRDDGGDRVNSRIVRFLTPGQYSLRVTELRARQLNARVSITRLNPLVSAGTVTLGAPLLVQIPTFSSYPRNDRDAAKEVAFTVAAPGTYTCDATTSDGQHDAQLALIQNGQLLVQDSDSGEGNNAQITRQLTAGTYTIRVWDWVHRAADITVSCHQ